MDETTRLLRRAQQRGFRSDAASERLRRGHVDQAEVLSSLDSSNHDERVEACRTLAMFGDRRAVPMLLRRYEGEQDRAIRDMIGRALDRLGGRKAVTGLSSLARTAHSADLREDATYHLGRTFDPDAAEALTAILSDAGEAPKVRGQAAESLSYVLPHCHPASRKRRRAVDALLAALSDPSPEVRFWAAFTLGQLRVKRSVEPLRSLAQDTAECPPFTPAQGLGHRCPRLPTVRFTHAHPGGHHAASSHRAEPATRWPLESLPVPESQPPRLPDSPLAADGQALLTFPTRTLQARQVTPPPQHDEDPTRSV